MEAPGLDALYSEPLDTFTAARNALAKALVQAADRGNAAVVKALRKPSIAAWALNQLSRTRPADVERLLSAGEELRAAQHDALEGGDPSRLREARRAHDAEVDRLADLAVEVLVEAGKPPAPAQRDRITATLQAVAGDEEARELFRRGRLERDLEPAGFGFTDDLTVASTPAPRERAPRRQAERPRRTTPAAAEREKDEAREATRREARRLAAAADRAAARADRLGREADEAERNAIELRKRADESREELAAARRAADEAGRRSESIRPVP
jgi:hypothetical protein